MMSSQWDGQNLNESFCAKGLMLYTFQHRCLMMNRFYYCTARLKGELNICFTSIFWHIKSIPILICTAPNHNRKLSQGTFPYLDNNLEATLCSLHRRDHEGRCDINVLICLCQNVSREIITVCMHQQTCGCIRAWRHRCINGAMCVCAVIFFLTFKPGETEHSASAFITVEKLWQQNSSQQLGGKLQ